MAIEQVPHCDQRVLHAPGECRFCDEHPDWQELRELWGINFTGKKDPEKSPCPSEVHRTFFTINKWPGNRPTEVPVELVETSTLDRILRDEEDD